MRPSSSRYRGPILAGLLLFAGTGLWVWQEGQLSAERHRIEARGHMQSLANALSILASQRGPEDDASLGEAIEANLVLGRPLRAALVTRGERTVARLGDPSFAPEAESESDLVQLQGGGIAAMHTVLARTSREDSTRGPRHRRPPWRWRAPQSAAQRGDNEPPLELHLAFDTAPPRHVDRGQRDRLTATLLLSWSAILGFALAWARNIRSRDLSTALDVERRERARLGDLNLAAAGLAHETMNPLGLIHGFAQQLVDDPETAPQGRDTAEKIIEETDRAAARLSDFINFARHVEVDIRPLSAKAVIARVAEALRPEYESRGVKLLTVGPELTIACDRGMFEQVLINLLLNSLAASEAGATTRVTWAADGRAASVAVRDEGGGIDPALLPDVFKPYVTGRADGHGLGLAIVKQIGDRHGWSLSIESDPGAGTRIVLEGIVLAKKGDLA